MSGQPPVQPPKLSYKSKAQREREEQERREREERDREERERLEEERQEQLRRQRREAERRRRQAEAARAAMAPPHARDIGAPPVREVVVEAPPPPRPEDLALFEEDTRGPIPTQLEDIEMLGAAEAEAEMVEEEAVEEEVPRPVRRPPRPPKSPDMRPVHAGFILVFTGLAQFLWGAWAMVVAPGEGEGVWDILPKWSMFVMGLIAAFLGLLAIRGGLWSFRKERFDVVKIGAIAATACVWALWVPWLFGALALLVIHKARAEYYPYYDPRWDAPSWAHPPPGEREDEGPEEEEEREEEEREEGEVTEVDEEEAPRDEMDAFGDQGLDEADVHEGDGWDDLA